MDRKVIRVAHSPDSDDAFMFYGLATDKIETEEFDFVHELHDIETLNQAALAGEYEVSAVSIHGYCYIQDRYALLNSGASMGEGYGPKVVSRQPKSREDIAGKIVAIPGERTSAFLALKLFQPDCRHKVFPFDEIMDAVASGEVEAGVIIHEGQLTYREHDLHQVVDLGEWWARETALPLPLGGNVIRRDLGDEDMLRIAQLLHRSIKFSLDNREEAVAYAQSFGRGLDETQVDRFVSLYVNERTLDYGPDGREAVQLFVDRGHEAGLIPNRVKVDFIG